MIFPSKNIFFFLLMIFLSKICQAQHRTYYISLQGNDNNTGLAENATWQTIDKLDSTQLLPGDTVLFKGGEKFAGTIWLSNEGNNDKAIYISSYDSGQAIIRAGLLSGLIALNCTNIHINNLEIEGDGISNNDGSGIYFYVNKVGFTPGNIVIGNCNIHGFHDDGILLNAAEDMAISGFHQVVIRNCDVYDNGNAGIAMLGSQLTFQHHNILIDHCTVHDNTGISSKADSHSGDGIVIGEADSVLIIHCAAYNNGEDNGCSSGGPVGIWVWMCRHAVIEYCESYHNHAGLNKDGGGFDIDGGSSDCILQYNYSHDNEGAGYLLAEYGAVFPFTNNIIRFNISENDGRKNGYGGIAVWGVDSAHAVHKSYIYNNTVFVDTINVINGTPSAIFLMGNNIDSVLVANNIFVARATATLVHASTPVDCGNIFFFNNDYYNSSGHLFVQWGNRLFHQVKNWQQYIPCQEHYLTKSYYHLENPHFHFPAGFLHNKNIKTGLDSPGNIYRLPAGSPLSNQGYMLKKYFSVSLPLVDFNHILLSDDIPIGAME